MANSQRSKYKFQLIARLQTGDTTVLISNDLWRDAAVAFTDASVVLTKDNGEFELCKGTAAAGTLTLSKRGLTESDTETEVSALKKDFSSGSIGYVTMLATDLVDREE